jgi:peptide/nickel transport system substrate-binding protein
MTFIKKIRFFVRFTKAFVKKWFGLILIGIGLGAIFYFLAPKIIKVLPMPLKTEKIGVLMAPKTMMNKFTIEDTPDYILDKISLGLTKISADGSVLPGLATNWEVSPDAKVYTFYFDKQFFWHDGITFHPKDVNYNFKDAAILPIDYRSLKIKLNEPFAPFLAVVSKPVFKTGLIGLGDYKVEQIEIKNKSLKSIKLAPVSLKDLPKLVYRFYLNDHDLRVAYKLGEIDKIEQLDNLGEFAGWKNLTSKLSPSFSQQVVLFFNTSTEPFSEKNFRQMIAYLISKEEGKNRSAGPISSTSWAFNPGIKRYDKDLDKAKLLLSKSKIDKDKAFVIHTFPRLEAQANKIKNDLEAAGLKMEIKLSQFLPDDFEMFLAVREIPSDPDQYSYWHTGQASNIARFSNPRIDKLLEDGRKTLNQEERKKIYYDFQRFLVEESPAVFLYYPSYYSLERK